MCNLCTRWSGISQLQQRKSPPRYLSRVSATLSESFTQADNCLSACKVAMTVLKNGGDALDAVELAIKVMEDREITNSGYGSNLSMDGTVECDATIVDHYGRSGAVGAVSRK